jgi:hypothetical protein
MIKWVLLMPLVWFMDYICGIINPNFREKYLNIQESLTQFLKED